MTLVPAAVPVECCRATPQGGAIRTMLETGKLALFLLGVLLLLVATLFELGATALLGAPGAAAGATDLPRPGIGIPYAGLLDLLLLYTLALLVAGFVPATRAVLARVQGVATFLLALVGLIAGLVLLFIAVGLLSLMVALLLAVPFGTAVYVAGFGTFHTGQSRAVLGIVMALKLPGIGLLLAAHPLLIRNLGLVLLLACSVGMTFLLGLLHALPPGFLVSITDAIGALVASVVALVWLVVFLVGAIPAVLLAIRSLLPRRA